jgi:hypothetical protein
MSTKSQIDKSKLIQYNKKLDKKAQDPVPFIQDIVFSFTSYLDKSLPPPHLLRSIFTHFLFTDILNS